MKRFIVVADGGQTLAPNCQPCDNLQVLGFAWGKNEEDEYYGERSSESLKFLERMCGEEELEFMGFEKDENGEWHFEDEEDE